MPVPSRPSFSPDGNQVAFSWDGDKGDNVDIYVKLLGEANALRLTTIRRQIFIPPGLRTENGLPLSAMRVFVWGGPGPPASDASVYPISPLGRSERRAVGFPEWRAVSWSPDGNGLQSLPTLLARVSFCSD